MKEIDFKQTKKVQPLKGTQKSTWPLDHPLVVAIQNLEPDSDECVETGYLTNSEVAGLYRRMREILPEQYQVSSRCDGPRQTYGSAIRNKGRKRSFWVVTKRSYKTAIKLKLY